MLILLVVCSSSLALIWEQINKSERRNLAYNRLFFVPGKSKSNSRKEPSKSSEIPKFGSEML